MKLKEWLIQTPVTVPGITTGFDNAVITTTEENGIKDSIGRDAWIWYICGRVHLLHILQEHGIPEDLEQIYHGESI